MKTPNSILVAFTLLAATNCLLAQGTSFTYQGQLQNNSSPANGNYDFTFALFNNSSTNTGQVGGTLTNLDTGVTNGLFTVTLDFGANFPGASRWLSIGVRTNSGSSFTALNPLQELTPTPYAIYTPNAGNAGTASNVASGIDITNAVITNSVFSGNGGGLTNITATRLAGGATLTNLTLVGQLTLPDASSGADIITSASQQLLYADNNYNFYTGFQAGDSDSTGPGNTADGDQALSFNTFGSYNTAVGQAALDETYSGSDNTAVGVYAIRENTTGSSNVAVGMNALGQLGFNNGDGGFNNIALGYQAGFNYVNNESSNIDIGNPGVAGENNVIRIGSNQTTAYIAGVITGNGGGLANLNAAKLTGALPTLSGAGLTSLTASNITAGGTLPVLNGANLTNLNASQLASGSNNNLFIGVVGGTTTSGQGNTAAGVSAFQYNTTGSFNVAYGQVALTANTTGGQNTAIGEVALYNNTTGSSNTAVGTCALLANTNGWYNTAIGNFALNSCSGGMSNIALGCLAGSAFNGKESNNIDIGNPGVAGENNTIRIGTAGPQTNTIIAGVLNGNGAGLTNLFASRLASGANNNLFIGVVGGTTTSGQGNTAAGVAAFQNNTTGSFNAIYGQVALAANTTGGQNTAIGEETLFFNTTGSSNTAVGTCALVANTNGWYNTAIGDFALNSCPEGMSNIALGCLAGLALNGKESNNIDIGNPGVAGENNTIRIGAAGVQTSAFIAGNVGLGGVTAPQQTLSLNGGMNIDQSSLNVGTTANALLFGSGSGEGIGSVRTGGYGDSYGLNFYTDFAKRMTIVQNGNVGIGTTNAVYPLAMGSGAYCSAAGVWTSVSDRNVKEDFTSIKPAEVLAKVAALPITEWKYKVERNGIKHLGPVAQDFYSSFGLGDNEKAIGTVDESGVALAAIQGLNQKLEETRSESKAKDAEIEKLKAKADKVDLLEKQLNDLKQMVQMLAEKN